MKHNILIVLIILLIQSHFNVYADTFDFTYDNQTLKYTVLNEADKTCAVAGYSSINGHVTIPTTVSDGTNNYTVTQIFSQAFAYCNNLSQVTISGPLKSIGLETFEGCSNLTSVALPSALESIEYHTFNKCSNLKSIIIPGNVKSIDITSFAGCRNLEDVTFEDSADILVFTNVSYTEGVGLFDACPVKNLYIGRNLDYKYNYSPLCQKKATLETLVLGDYVTTMHNSFSGCSNLKNISLGNSLTTIENSVFEDCASISHIEFGSSLSVIGSNNFNNCKSLYYLYFPEKLEAIGYGSFSGCENLSSISFNGNLRSIGPKAFSYCRNLTNVTFRDGYGELTIGENSFSYAPVSKLYLGRDIIYQNPDNHFREIESLTISNTVHKICDYSFQKCRKLEKVVFGDSVTHIGDYAFDYCENLKYVYFQNSVVSIGEKAFSYTEVGRQEMLYIPPSVEYIGDYAFNNSDLNKGLPGVNAFIGYNIKHIGYKAFGYYSATIFITAPTPPNGDGCCFDRLCVLGGSLDLYRARYYSNSWDTWNTWEIPSSINIEIDDPNNYRYDCIGLKTSSDVFLKSSRPDIAKVNRDGIVTIVGDLDDQNPCIITAESIFPNVPPTSIAITKDGPVILTSAIKLDRKNIVLKIGGETVINATVLPENAADRTVIWSSSDENIVTVDNYGKIHAIADGEAVITASCGGVSSSCNVSVTLGLPTAIELDHDKIELKIGEETGINATVLPEDATVKTVTWSSSDESIVTVDDYGKIHAVDVGEAVITASCEGVSSSCNVSVMPILAQSLRLSESMWSGTTGESFKITATVLPENTTYKTVEYKSSDENVATVDASGTVTIHKAGTCVITVSTTDGSGLKSSVYIIGKQSGIDAIFSDENIKVDVYNLQGILLKKECGKTDLKALAPGLYIFKTGASARTVMVK